MSDEATTPDPKPAKKAAKPAKPPADTRVAKIKTLASGVKAKGFTFGAKQTVPGVPIAHAEYLVSKKHAEILEVL